MPKSPEFEQRYYGKECIGCKKIFYPTPSCVKHPSHFKARKYCSAACCSRNAKRKPLSEAQKIRIRSYGKKYGFKKGYTPWNKGTSISTPGAFRKGNIPWNKGVPFVHVRGEKNINWKGGITSLNKKIRHSLEYVNWRRSVFERDDYTCVFCGVRGGKLNADHIKRFADYPELRMDINNGRTLCEPCHKLTPTFGRRVMA